MPEGRILLIVSSLLANSILPSSISLGFFFVYESCESKSIQRANAIVAREKGTVKKVRINTVTIVRLKFSEVYGVFRALYSSPRLFSIIFKSLTGR